jgi:hypothetical protein
MIDGSHKNSGVFFMIDGSHTHSGAFIWLMDLIYIVEFLYDWWISYT